MFTHASLTNVPRAVCRTALLGCLCLAMLALIAGCDGPEQTANQPEITPTVEPTTTVPPPSTTAPKPQLTTTATPQPAASGTPRPAPTPAPSLQPTTPSRMPAASPSPEPTPVPDPTSSPTPTPPPEPAVYAIDDLQATLIGAGNGVVTAEFSFSIKNVGGPGGPVTIPVVMEIDGLDPEIVEEADRPLDANPVRFSVIRDMEPRQHTILLRVGDAEQTLHVDASAADVVMRPVGHTIVGDGSIELSVKVTNTGDASAHHISVSANLAQALGEAADAPPTQTDSYVVGVLPPGESQTVTVPLQVPTGSHIIMLNAETESLEAVQDNNGTETTIEVEYVSLTPSLDSAMVVGYENDGDGVVEAVLGVRNDGVAPSGPISVGLSCPSGAIGGCAQSVDMESISSGDSSTVALTLTLPQGETPVIIFAGALDDGYRWGDANVQQTSVEVPSKPAVSLAMQAEVNVTGYWSNGTAEVEIMASLRNDGYQQVSDSQVITVVCQQDGETLSDCGGELPIGLANGFGPAGDNLPLTAPMGSTLEVSLGEDEDNVQLEVPERILGVDRYVWECYSDRPALTSVAGEASRQDGCGGWYFGTAEKWDLDRPVRVWATGHPEYIRILKLMLSDLPSLLNLQFENVAEKTQVDIEAYVGVPRSFADETPLEGCIDYGGCASQHNEFGVVRHGTFVVWQIDNPSVTADQIRHVVLHELMHIVVPIGHRMALDTRLASDSGLSVVDEELIRLHSHPLIRPGMAIDEIRELIVLNEDLLDPQSPSPYWQVHEVLREVDRVLQEAGSVRLHVSGEWSGGTCGHHRMGQAVYELGGIGQVSAKIVRYRKGDDHYLILDGSEYWSEGSTGWETTTGRAIFDATRWAPAHPNPFTVLTSLLALGNDENISIASRDNGKMVIKTLKPLTERVATSILTVDEETHHIESYETMIRLQGGCRLVFGGENGEYGIDIEVPEEILQTSAETDDSSDDSSR